MSISKSIRAIQLSIVLLSAGVLATQSALAEDDKAEGNDTKSYVVLMTQDDASVEALFERYPELAGSWEELAKYNLLRSGIRIEIPTEMLAAKGMLAKVASHYGEVEVKRSFDNRFIPLVDNLLLREGDEIRTWRRSGVRILFEDGNYVLLKSHSKAKIVSLGNQEMPAATRVQILLKEGGLWSTIERKLHGTFEIRTTMASTIIRGTDFRVKVEPGEATRLEVLDGLVDFEVGDRRLSVSSQEGALANAGVEPLASVPLPPAPDELTSPQQEEVLRSDVFDQVFAWSAVPGADAYRLEIARDEQFFDLVDERQVSASSVRIQRMEPGTYFWRVSTKTADGFEGPPTGPQYFVFVQRQP